jgi:acyl carrier protein
MNIDISTFVLNFASQFDETPIEAFTAETKFKELDEWSSMTALVIIAMVDKDYKVKLSGNEIKISNTVQDIFETIIAKVNG